MAVNVIAGGAGRVADSILQREAHMAQKNQHATPSHRAVGRIVRAITYPIISAKIDLTLRELNALATLAHTNQDVGVSATAPATMGKRDSFDALSLTPGCNQALWSEEQFIAATDKLAELGLATIEHTTGPRLHLAITPGAAQEGPGRIVTLTGAGYELVDSLAGNLAKSLSLLDNTDVRDDLSLYEPA